MEFLGRWHSHLLSSFSTGHLWASTLFRSKLKTPSSPFLLPRLLRTPPTKTTPTGARPRGLAPAVLGPPPRLGAFRRPRRRREAGRAEDDRRRRLDAELGAAHAQERAREAAVGLPGGGAARRRPRRPQGPARGDQAAEGAQGLVPRR